MWLTPFEKVQSLRLELYEIVTQFELSLNAPATRAP